MHFFFQFRMQAGRNSAKDSRCRRHGKSHCVLLVVPCLWQVVAHLADYAPVTADVDFASRRLVQCVVHPLALCSRAMLLAGVNVLPGGVQIFVFVVHVLVPFS